MNKIKLILLSFLMIFCIAGCSSSKSNDEIKNILNDNEYKISYYNIYSSISIYNDDHRFTYNSENKKCYYINRDIYENAYDLENNTTFNPSTVAPDKSVDKEITNQFEETIDAELKRLNISKDELVSYIKYDLNAISTKYNKMSSKEKLIDQFENCESDIKALTDEEVEKYLKYHEDNPTASFQSIKENVFLQDDKCSDEVYRIINNLKTVSNNSKTKWSMENFDTYNTNGSTYITYDYYVSYTNTNFDFTFIYNSDTLEFNGLIFSCEGGYKKIDSTDIITIMTGINTCVDESLKSNSSKALSIASKSYSSPVSYNNWVYSTEIDKSNASIKYYIAPLS